MRTMDFRPGRGRARKRSVLAQVELLIGDRRRYVGALASLSLLSGFSEGLFLAVIAQVAYKIVNGKGGSSRAGLLHIGASVNTLLLIALGLALFRLLLQWPISVLPAKIAADVQQSLRKRVFRAFSNASWDVQSRDREGTLQEIMTNQTSQATGGALQATSLVSTSLVFVILMGFAIALSPTAAGAIFVIALALFALMRPMRMLGAQAQSRTLPGAGALRGRRSRRPTAWPRSRRCSVSPTPSTSACSASSTPAATSSSARR